MWSKIDDSFPSHPKVLDAGQRIGGPDGPALAIATYVVALAWSNKFLTNGALPEHVVRSFTHCAKPLKVAQALVAAHLWDATPTGFKIHDFLDFNFSRDTVESQRKRDRERHQRGGHNSHAVPRRVRQ